jgi:beta-N-acetylhexosaminidase
MRLNKRFISYVFFFSLSLVFTLMEGCVSSKIPVSAELSNPPLDSSDVDKIVGSPTDWVENQLKQMSLDEKIAQMIFARANGYYISTKSNQYNLLEFLVNQLKIGGLVFFQGDIHTSAVMINRLQKLSKIPLMIASDMEWGTAMRLRRGTRFPEAMALGATRDTAFAYFMGKAIGVEAKAVGINQVYAPVADVNTNPDNPVINTRSFGEDPQLVADMASAFSRGLESANTVATAKHFPGHGDTHIDSHIGLPLLNVSHERLDSVELVPFRQLINDGVLSVMVGHIDVPELSGTKGVSASVSPKVTNEFLRGRLGFQGVIVTDAMEMGAVANGVDKDQPAVAAVEAGADIIVLPPGEQAAISGIKQAVLRGRISEERINKSVTRILNLKQWTGLNKHRFVDVEKISDVVEIPEHLDLAKDIARKSITVLKNDNILPLGINGEKNILTVFISDVEDYRTEINRPGVSATSERVGDYFNSILRKTSFNITSVRIDPSTNAMAIDSIVNLAKDADVVLVPVFSKGRSGSGKFGLPNTIVSTIERILGENKSSVLIAMGSPYVLSEFPDAKAYVCSYSDAECATEATLEVLCGIKPASGRLPVTIPGLFPYGSGISLPVITLRTDQPKNVGFNAERLNSLDTVMYMAINDSAFPGAQLLVARDGRIVYDKCFGSLDYTSASPLVNKETIFDLASLTKVVATTTATMKLYDENLLQLDDSVVKYIPEFGNHGKEKITVRNLLLHNSGLPAYKQFYLTCKSSQEVLDSVYQASLVYPTGDSELYSDLGFIMLGKIVEKITDTPLDKYVDSVLFKPLFMFHTMFNPPSSFSDNIAPTEWDSVFRKQLIRGIVHDENAYLLGGVSGHAGLFSTASDLAIFMQMLMNGGTYRGIRYLSPETIQLFTTRADTHNRRALGWDIKTMNGYSSAGSLFGPASFGHTGFTGTSIWVEPEKKIFVILLTNRVHPTRNNHKIMQIRSKVHDMVISSLEK